MFNVYTGLSMFWEHGIHTEDGSLQGGSKHDRTIHIPGVYMILCAWFVDVCQCHCECTCLNGCFLKLVCSIDGIYWFDISHPYVFAHLYDVLICSVFNHARLQQKVRRNCLFRVVLRYVISLVEYRHRWGHDDSITALNHAVFAWIAFGLTLTRLVVESCRN